MFSEKKSFIYALLFIVVAFTALFFYNKQPYTQGTFWEVSKDGEVLGHILGTIHMNDEKVTKLDKKVMDIFDNSVGYSIEAFPSSHLWNPYHGFENIKKKMMFEDKTLADVAGKKTANDVFQILTKNGVNEEYATKIKPWAAMFSIAAKSKHSGPIIDHKLLDLASIQEKEIYQIESPEELLAAFYAMPMESQVELLKSKIEHFPKIQETLDEMVNAYLDEDLQSLMDASTSFVDKSDYQKNKHLQVYLKHSVYIRNIVMAHYMNLPFLYGLDRYKGQGGTFVCVGALHLLGEKGVLSLLEKQYGYEIKRIKFK
ncbi:TraB/GumN family protein [Gammaproteobacteria bacterium]|nr:TraB/GumN family protein [Gammaproteobacteria bacterium]